MKDFFRRLAASPAFEIFIIAVIIVNSVLIGVETYFTTPGIHFVQTVILGIFTVEILARFIARRSLKEFFSNAWNVFDLFLVLINYIPESIVENTSMLMALRVLRIFRVLRLLRTSKEIKLIISVLSRSFSALFYNGVFFFIFIYLFAILGVALFRLPAYETLSPDKQELYLKLQEVAPPTPENSPDPYGTLTESMFTLFRALTGEDWTDLRYNLVVASDYGLIHTPSIVVTGFHVVWFVLAAFLLLNLVVGAIVNNYQVIMEETRVREEKEAREKALANGEPYPGE